VGDGSSLISLNDDFRAFRSDHIFYGTMLKVEVLVSPLQQPDLLDIK